MDPSKLEAVFSANQHFWVHDTRIQYLEVAESISPTGNAFTGGRKPDPFEVKVVRALERGLQKVAEAVVLTPTQFETAYMHLHEGRTFTEIGKVRKHSRKKSGASSQQNASEIFSRADGRLQGTRLYLAIQTCALSQDSTGVSDPVEVVLVDMASVFSSPPFRQEVGALDTAEE